MTPSWKKKLLKPTTTFKNWQRISVDPEISISNINWAINLILQCIHEKLFQGQSHNFKIFNLYYLNSRNLTTILYIFTVVNFFMLTTRFYMLYISCTWRDEFRTSLNSNTTSIYYRVSIQQHQTIKKYHTQKCMIL